MIAQVFKQQIPEVLLIKPTLFLDKRGYFSEIFRSNEFEELGIPPFVQENLSFSEAGVVRGLHYQERPWEVGKLVSCVSGSIFDVAVDIRKYSPTYLKWVMVELTPFTGILWIPPGFAHGFCTTEKATVLYRQTGYFNKEADRSIRWNDPDIGIDWPVKEPVLSAKDEEAPLAKELK